MLDNLVNILQNYGLEGVLAVTLLGGVVLAYKVLGTVKNIRDNHMHELTNVLKEIRDDNKDNFKEMSKQLTRIEINTNKKK